MAENQNYIGVAMGLDVTDLKAGLSEANKQIQLANSEFKAASSGMEDWTKSTEGLTAKVKQLDTVLKLQKSKLAGLQAEYEKVAEEQGENSEAARKLKVQINNQQAVVNKTQREFDNYTDTLKQAEAGTLDLADASLRGGKAVSTMGDGANEAGSKMGGFGSIAGGVIGVVAGLGAAIAGAVGGFLALASSTREAREDMAKLTSAFAGAKMSADSANDTYTKLFSVIGESDTAVEAAQQIALLANSEEEAAKWAEQAANVTAVFGDALKPETYFEAANETLKLGEATGAFTQMLEGTGVNVEDFNAELASLTTEQEKQAYMLEVSQKAMGEAGAAYKETAGDIMSAREAEAKLSLAMQELGAVAEPIMTALTLLAVDLLESVKPLVELIGTGLRGVIDGTAGSAEKLGEGLGGMFDVLLTKAQELLPQILEMILQIIPQVVSTILGATPQILSALVSLVMLILEQLPMLYEMIYTSVLGILPVLVSKILSLLPTLIQGIVDFVIVTIGTVLPNLVNQLLTMIPSVITSIIDGVVAAFPVLIQAVIDLLALLVTDTLPTLISEITTALPLVINSIVDGLVGAIPQILEAAIVLLMAIIDAIPVLVEVLFREVPKLVVSIVTSLLSKIPDIQMAAYKLLFQIVEAVPKIALQLLKAIPKIIISAVKGLKEGIPEMKKAGLNMLEGIWAGIKNGRQWLKDKIFGFAGNVADWFKSVFKISSPSKLMKDEVGRYLGEGIGVGVIDSIPTVKKQLGQFAGFVSDNLGGIKSGLNVEASGTANTSGGRSIGSTVINAGMTVNYNGNLSRKQLKQLENDNYTAIRTRLRAEGAI